MALLRLFPLGGPLGGGAESEAQALMTPRRRGGFATRGAWGAACLGGAAGSPRRGAALGASAAAPPRL
eukprot:CAMPEP_0115553270 /NCGR_PEP_ID=MMETSP0271-20121206/96682_1 /TAXON_ID=71861 /ORGANISM="Scrippsiella trochoidea, Strain CCMP3099" /LENGTH=67 /DNA_ID=CAMNT_0002986941 /DNA_START=27 /DNA_END=227 /DNA_ORIENTATION=-